MHAWTHNHKHQSSCIDRGLCLFFHKNSGECLRVQCEALTQFLPESRLGGSAGHGHLYYDPPDAEFPLGPQDPKVSMSYHSFKKNKICQFY